MKLLVSESDIDPTIKTDGSDRSWRDQARTLCQQAGFRAELFVKGVVHALNPNLKGGRLKSAQHRVWVAFSKRVPVVPIWLRQTIAHFLRLLRSNQPLPVAVVA